MIIACVKQTLERASFQEKASVIIEDAILFLPRQHWCSLRYPLLGAPIAYIWPQRLFFLVDLGCILASFAGFVIFARQTGFSSLFAFGAFLFGSLDNPSLRLCVRAC